MIYYSESHSYRPHVFVPRVNAVTAMLWTGGNWPHISSWVYGRLVTNFDEVYDDPKYPVLPTEDGVRLSVVVRNHRYPSEVFVGPGEWLVHDGNGWLSGGDEFERNYCER